MGTVVSSEILFRHPRYNEGCAVKASSLAGRLYLCMERVGKRGLRYMYICRLKFISMNMGDVIMPTAGGLHLDQLCAS